MYDTMFCIALNWCEWCRGWVRVVGNVISSYISYFTFDVYLCVIHDAMISFFTIQIQSNWILSKITKEDCANVDSPHFFRYQKYSKCIRFTCLRFAKCDQHQKISFYSTLLHNEFFIHVFHPKLLYEYLW